MKINNFEEANKLLNELFSKINLTMFSNLIVKPVIAIIPHNTDLSSVTVTDSWLSDYCGRKLLCIGANILSKPIEYICAEIIHLAVHIYCMQQGIKDTSNRGVYHNKKFKLECENRGLVLKYDRMRGYNITLPTNQTTAWCNKNGFKDIKISCSILDRENCISKATNTRKYLCPICNNSVRATKNVNIICGDCHEQMIVDR